MITATYNAGRYRIHCWVDVDHWQRVRVERARLRDRLTWCAMALLGTGPARW